MLFQQGVGKVFGTCMSYITVAAFSQFKQAFRHIQAEPMQTSVAYTVTAMISIVPRVLDREILGEKKNCHVLRVPQIGKRCIKILLHEPSGI